MAKKSPKLEENPYPGIWEFTPWLWRECSLCMYRFRFVNMWMTREYICIDSHTTYYACKECCPTRKEFDKHLHPQHADDARDREINEEIDKILQSYDAVIKEVKVVKALKTSTKHSRFKEIDID